MLINRLRIHNLHSLRAATEIDFTASPLADTGLFAITGDTGAGKTTILDGLTLALYGKICRNSDEKEALSYGAEEGAAECEFEAKGRRFLAQWSIRRRRSKKENNFQVERSVAEWVEEEAGFIVRAAKKVTEVNRYVEEVTGLDFGRFTRSVLLAQGDFATFLKAAPKERSDLLERITGTEIYSELSKGALLRFREEEAKLQDLVKQREALMIFSKEEIKEKKNQLQQQEGLKRDLKSKSAASKAALQWLREVDVLEKKQQTGEAELVELQARKEKMDADIRRLDLHAKTIPFHSLLARHDDRASEIAQLEADIQRLQAGQAANKGEEEKALGSLASSQSGLDATKASQPASMRLFDEVAGLDATIENRAGFLKQLQSDLSAKELELASIDGQLKDLGQKKAAWQEALDASVSWLRQHEAISSLPQELLSIELLRSQLRALFTARKEAQQEKEVWVKRVGAAGAKRDIAAQKVETGLALMRDLALEFKKLAPAGFAMTRAELLEKLTLEVESLGDRHKNFRQLKALNDEYTGLLSELSDLETRLDNLRREESALDKTLLTVMEETDELDRQLSFKQAVYNQQLRIANYEKDRASLKENEPCPLCFSTHHPFRQHHSTPFADEAKKELEAVQKRYQLAFAEQKALLMRHRETSANINQISGPDAGSMDKLKSRLHDCESKIAALMPGWNEEEISRTYGNWLSLSLSEYEKSLSEKKAAREQLSALHQKIELEEKKLQHLQDELKDRDFETAQAGNSLKHHERMLAEAEKQFSEATKELDKRVGKYGYRFSVEEANGMFHELAAKAEEFTRHSANVSEYQKQLELNAQAFSQRSQSKTELGQKIASVQKTLLEDSNSLEQLREKRAGLFGDQDPKSAREGFLKKLERLRDEYLEARRAVETIKTELARQQQAINSSQGSLEKSRKVLAETSEAILKGIQKAGFESIVSLREAIMPEEEAKQTGQQAKDLQHREIAIRQQLQTVQTELAAAKESPLTDSRPDALLAEIAGIEKELETIEQGIGAVRQQMADNDSRKATAKSLLQQTELQRQDFNRWAALYDLIGSADGKKFRIFAQGLTLQKLVQLANQHLAKLFGRYLIIKRPGEDLELDIVDTYQADNIRSMHTLSGGESFLVSLALALGLSDLAGRDANIRSLFIDEGFGTLDDETLDLAISTLENLQASGKTIGIISHVKELKERIATQIRVVKKGGGVSVVEVVG